MKLLFWGDTRGNAGPMNINKGITGSLTDRFRYVRPQGKYRELVQALWMLLWSDGVVVSGISRKGCILAAGARLLGKPSVYIMHGCAVYENALNRRSPTGREEQQEQYLLKQADLLLPVSEKFMHWVQGQYPQYAHKTEYLFNGIDVGLFENPVCGERQPGSILAVGGMRAEKNNLPLAEAVERMQGKASLQIYGNPFTGPMPGKHHVRFEQTASHAAFLQALGQTRVFVLNSVFEPFGISVMEALACGCSILVSEAAGAGALLALEETDIIHDPMDVEEIRRKTDYLLTNPNNHRLLSQFRAQEWSFGQMVLRLEKRCEELGKESK